MPYSISHSSPLQVRLVGGGNDAEGTVNVMHNGSWGTVCDLNWDLRDAKVVCRMLGFDGAFEAPKSAWFGNGSGRVLLNWVKCDGSEENLADCKHPGVGDYSYCGHNRDAGVVCFLEVRLADGAGEYEGRVEILHEGTWGTVCDDLWDLDDATVVCRHLGFEGALAAFPQAHFGEGSGDIFLDGVQCNGSESNLKNCNHRGIGVNNCAHEEDASVICRTTDPFSILLINGTNDSEGRVTILYKGEMGTICDDNWDLRDARVVCSMLGYDGALAAPGRATFGAGSGKILFDVGCKGTEDTLVDCFHRGLGVNNCNHDSDAGVVCFTRGHSSPLQVRLVGGGNDAEGTVNVMHNGSWGTVCDFNWDLRDAKVVCRMLGFDGALEAPKSAWFGQGSGRVLLNWVKCDGSEENLADCKHPGVGDYSYCGHNRDAGVVCFLEVRLADGAGEHEGRVEILHEGTWGTVCDDLWDLDDATVVCRHLGFEGALAALPQAHFGEGSGDIFLDGVQCNGSESSLKDCNHRGIGVNNCAHEEDASVICRTTGFTTYLDTTTSDEIYSTDTPWLKSSTPIGYETTDPPGTQTTANSTPRHPLNTVTNKDHRSPLSVRLVNGSNNAEGRVEVMHDGSWGTICDYDWDLRDARVVCRMLGFGGALEAPGYAWFGQGSGRALLTFVNCEGSEDKLPDCGHAGIGQYSCSHSRDAGAICYSGTNPDPLQVRLAGGSHDAEGRVEVMHDGSWGTVCDVWWDLRDARVVCTMMGFHGALEAPRSARFGQGSGRVLLKFVNCEGSEDNLADCAHAGIGRYSCNHERDAGATCVYEAKPNPLLVRLIGGSSNSEGRVEVLHDGSWGTVCDINWDLRDAKVVCRMLGFDGALEAPGYAQFGQGSGPVLLTYVSCEGTEENLSGCTHAVIGRYSCSHSRDAGAVCFNGAPFQVQLVNGSNDFEGRVEVMYNGSWGTICDDEWDLRDARVVCKMLAFDGALDAPGSATFGQGSGNILLEDVSCESTYGDLADCYHRGVGVSNCRHEEDSGAICFTGGKREPFKVLLRNGSKASEGRVEIMYNGSWGTICGSSWDVNDARVVCRMLGFDGALAAPVSGEFGRSKGDIFLSDVQCDGTENSLANCNHAGIGVNNCKTAIDSGAICFSGVRLIGGTNNAEGRVEILHDGSWGTVCDDSWDLKDAEVVCRMLGFVGALEAPLDAQFGKGSGIIFLDEVQCNGTEIDLEHCDHEGIGLHNCAHNEDASVICIQPGIELQWYITFIPAEIML
nr:deleted in malignant brain tumors 1 protein-like [Lytechinus pictus]